MPEETSKWRLVERAKMVLEILAIIIAGLWAITLYLNYDAPSNVTRADLQGDLKWYPRSKEVCEAEYEVEFKNIGRIPIDIGRVQLSVFPMDRLDHLPEGKKVGLIDPMQAISGPPFIQAPTDRMNAMYSPDERDVEGFSFIVKRAPGTLILFQVEVWKKEDGAVSNAKPWRDFRWDWVCGENPETQEGGQ